MKRLLLTAVLLFVAPPLAIAHVTVRPRESKPGADERYVVRVPTEGAVTTTSVRVEIPDGVTVIEIDRADGATFETEKRGDRVVAITWKTDIKPKEVAEFSFRARNPASGSVLTWKAHQHFADGTVVDWVGPPGDRRPAAATTLH